MKKIKSPSDSEIEIMKSIPHLAFSKATMRQVQIIEAAIYCYANFGMSETTFDRIAKQAKLSRPLIFHYFSDKSEIFDGSIKYVRAVYQQLTIEGIEKGRNGKERFENYVQCCFDWLVKHPYHIKLWFVFYHSASTTDKYRDMNSDFVSIGLDRIAAMIQKIEGNETMNRNTAAQRARSVQALITGAIVQMSSESADIIPKDFTKLIAKQCLEMAIKK